MNKREEFPAESAAAPSVPGVRVEALRRVAGNTVQVGKSDE